MNVRIGSGPAFNLCGWTDSLGQWGSTAHAGLTVRRGDMADLTRLSLPFGCHVESPMCALRYRCEPAGRPQSSLCLAAAGRARRLPPPGQLGWKVGCPAVSLWKRVPAHPHLQPTVLPASETAYRHAVVTGGGWWDLAGGQHCHLPRDVSSAGQGMPGLPGMQHLMH